ncbi:MAG: 2-dehydro-3-deoxygalactonokinase [Rhizobiaceae bacterium]|nr:2-dehydro-3-deoxygalactonokinase [Rhizobiaceae bacterium]
MTMKPDWIAVDWGTTNMRVWAIGAGGEVLSQATSDKGMGGLTPDAFEPALLELVTSWLPDDRVIDVIACGMVGARQGWVEAAYGKVPCAPFAEENTIHFSALNERMRVHIIAGLQQDNPADVMRGEETQIAGLLADDPDFEGVVCAPGTHTKWVRIESGKIVHFATHLTGEMFSLLADKSVLRHTTASEGWDEAEFLRAFAAALGEPDKITAHLFSVRAEALIGDLSPQAARSRLSALLLGLEFNATREDWSGQKAAIIGSDALAKIYQQALLSQGADPIILDGEALTLAGLKAARDKIILKEIT